MYKRIFMVVMMLVFDSYAIDRCAIELEEQRLLWHQHEMCLDGLSKSDLAAAAWMGRECLELDLQRTQGLMLRADRNRYDELLRPLLEQIRMYTKKTIALLVVTNQIDVAMVVARGFAQGLEFHFI